MILFVGVERPNAPTTGNSFIPQLTSSTETRRDNYYHRENLMKEFMLLIRNEGGDTSTLSPGEHHEFLMQCETYIGRLKAEGKLIAAQPLAREGTIISGSKVRWKETAVDVQKEIQVGYYHIFANDLDEAIAIAKRNPEFEYGTTASIEVRPIKTAEQTTGFVYPKML
jgi:hypothetical protein